MISKPFQGLRTFCKTSDDTTKRFAVIGLPSDTATSYRPGARFAPAAIRESSMMLTDGYHPYFNVNIRDHTVDLGDADITVGNTLKMLEQVETVTNNVLNWNKHTVFLGGDHTVTIGILRAMNKRYGKIAVVHFDAHCDTWRTNFDEPVGHGTWLYNAITEELVDPTKIISIGIRSPSDSKSRNFLDHHGGTTFTARYAQTNLMAVISNTIKIIDHTPVYLTFDIDALDPAYAPGTGTPEIGGLSSMWVLECLEYLAGLNWIGMDLVEVSPPYDHAEITSLAAATICWTYLSMVIAKNLQQSTEIDDVHDCGADVDDNTDFRPVEKPAVTRPTGPTGPS